MGYKCAFTVLSLATIGVVIGLLAVAIILYSTTEMNGLDSSIMLALCISLCISLVLFSYAFYAIFCYGKYSRIVLAFIFLILGALIIILGIAVLLMRDKLVHQARGLWNETEVSSIGKWLEDKLDCCGFDESTKRNCTISTRCEKKISDLVQNYSGWISGISIGLAVLIFALLIYALWQTLSKSDAKGTSQLETKSLDEPLNEDGSTTNWF